jgi:NAD(P)H-flavin reductase
MNESRATFQGEVVHCRRTSRNEFELIIPRIMVERDLKPGQFTINDQKPKKLVWENTGPAGTRIRAII